MKKPTILFATGAVDGGAWRRLIELLWYLDAKGYAMHLITYDNPDLAELRGVENLQVHALQVNKASRGVARITLAVLRKLMTLKFDGPVWLCSYAGNAALGFALYRAFARRELRVLMFLRGAELSRLDIRLTNRGATRVRRALKTALHRLVMNISLRATDVLVAQTEIGLRALRDNYPAARGLPSFVLPNNVNTRWITEQQRSAPVLPRVPGAFHVAFVGRIKTTVKGLDTLVDAAARLQSSNVLFDVVGDGEDLDANRRAIAAHGLTARFTLHGWLKNPFSVVNRADLVVVPSRSDPLPNVVLEGFAAGKPVIGARVDGIPVMLQHEELMFEPGDEKSLAHMIDRAATDEIFYHQIHSLCRSRMAQFSFDWAARFEEILVQDDLVPTPAVTKQPTTVTA